MRKLTIPGVLAVTALGVGCPADDGGDTGNDAGTSSSGTTMSVDSSGTSSSGSSSTSGEGSSSGPVDTSGTTTGDLPDCAALEEETTCAGEPACAWIMGLGCRADCGMIGNHSLCVESGFCYWFEDECHTPL